MNTTSQTQADYAQKLTDAAIKQAEMLSLAETGASWNEVQAINVEAQRLLAELLLDATDRFERGLDLAEKGKVAEGKALFKEATKIYEGVKSTCPQLSQAVIVAFQRFAAGARLFDDPVPAAAPYFAAATREVRHALAEYRSA